MDINKYIIVNTGFKYLDFSNLDNKKELETLFPEFLNHIQNCKFRNCLHDNEPQCGIKAAVENNDIPRMRYDFYLNSLENIFKN